MSDAPKVEPWMNSAAWDIYTRRNQPCAGGSALVEAIAQDIARHHVAHRAQADAETVARLAAAEALLRQVDSYLQTHPMPPDHACRYCVGEATGTDFVCSKHAIRAHLKGTP